MTFKDALKQLQKRRWVEAESLLVPWTEQHPMDGVAWVMLGHARLGAGMKSAVEAYRLGVAELEKSGGNSDLLSEAHQNLGTLLVDEDASAAVSHMERALQLKGPDAELLTNLGQALCNTGRVRDSVAVLIDAVTRNPNSVRARMALSEPLMLQGRVGPAMACWEQVLVMVPDDPAATSALLFGRLYLPEYSSGELFEYFKNDGLKKEPAIAEFKVAPGARGARNGDPDCRLRVGYVSADFRRHPVAAFLAPLFRHRDPARVELFAYSNGRAEDDRSDWFREHSDGWRDVAGLSDDAVATQIRDDEIDVLVDCSGHSLGHRLGVFARRPSPVQITWLGMPSTTGLSYFDGRITDSFVEPPGSETLSTEPLVRLDPCYLGWEPSPDSPELQKHRPEGPFTFGCFNNPAKLSDPCLALWVDILSKTPESQLLLKAKVFGDEGSASYFRKRFAKLGGDELRLVLLGHRKAESDHLADYQVVDLALDPFPYNGVTTTFEALHMGVPVLTLPGDRPVSRHGLSILRAMHLDEFIAASPEDYVSKAVAWARNQAALPVREALRRRLLDSPMCDGPSYAKRMEAAFRVLLQRFVDEQC